MFWHTISQVDVIKVGVRDIGSKTFTPQGEDVSCEFSPYVCLCAKGGIYVRMCLSLTSHFVVGTSYLPDV